MNIWLIPTSNPLINTFLRSLVVILFMILGLGTTWYGAYWGAVIHDIVSLVLIYPMVK